MGDPMDLGGFMQNFVLNNPFQDVKPEVPARTSPPVVTSAASPTITTDTPRHTRSARKNRPTPAKAKKTIKTTTTGAEADTGAVSEAGAIGDGQSMVKSESSSVSTSPFPPPVIIAPEIAGRLTVTPSTPMPTPLRIPPGKCLILPNRVNSPVVNSQVVNSPVAHSAVVNSPVINSSVVKSSAVNSSVVNSPVLSRAMGHVGSNKRFAEDLRCNHVSEANVKLQMW